MAGYRPAVMVRTPWGEASELRSRMLSRGPGTPPEEVRRNQRERLFAAMVATVAEKGYEATRVEDLEALSGVSRSTFYRLFPDKQACFLAAVEALVEPTIAIGSMPAGQAPSLDVARQAFTAFVELIVRQAAASRMCFVELYAAGPEAVEVADRAMDAFQGLMQKSLEQMPGRQRMPPVIARAMVGGLRKIVHTRLYRREEEDLLELIDEMWQWGLSYLPPPRPLRRPRRRQPRPRPPLEEIPDTDERLLRATAVAVTERGYPETKVADIVETASASVRTFYEHFPGKEEAMLAALDRGSALMLAATLPAFRRGPDWPSAVRGSLAAMLAFGAEEPEFTRLGTIEIYAAGRRALEQRDEVMGGLESLLAAGYELAPETPAIAAEAIGGAVYSLIYDQVRAGGPESLPQIGPVATYLALVPFIGAEQACEVANGGRLR
jgi:AcrR family transcriptional regulator